MSDYSEVVQKQLEALKTTLFAQDFDSLTPESVQELLLAFLQNEAGLSTAEGSLVQLLVAPGAYVFWEALQALRAQQYIAFPDASSGQYIDLDAARYGIYRKAGTQAVLTLAVTGTAGTVIPKGTLCATADGLTFGTDAALTLDADGNGAVTATATLIGTAYNIGVGEIQSTQYAVSGVTSVTNTTEGVGGTNAETDAALYARLDALRKTPATSGNERHYKDWALEVNGVGAANIIRCWDGGGTVKVVIADMSMQPATDALCEAVAAHIETLRPVTAEVTVASAAGIVIDIVAEASLDGTQSLADVQTAFETLLAAYLSDVTYNNGTQVVWAKVLSLLVGISGVRDCPTLTLDGMTANVSINAGDIALLGTLTLTEVV